MKPFPGSKAQRGGCLGELIFSPIGCLVKLFVAAGAIFLLIMMASMVIQPAAKRGPGGGIQKPPQGSLTGGGGSGVPIKFNRVEFRLTQYPLLNQLDSGIYDPPSLAKQIDPEFNTPVKNIACLATVCLMLERGRGNRTAMLRKSSFDSNYNAKTPGYVGASEPFNGEVIAREIRAGRPVVIEGVGGPLKAHYMLAVGLKPKGGRDYDIEVLDPYHGHRVLLDGSLVNPRHPNIRDLTITGMRRVK